MRVNAGAASSAAEMKASKFRQRRGEIHGRKGGRAAWPLLYSLLRPFKLKFKIIGHLQLSQLHQRLFFNPA